MGLINETDKSINMDEMKAEYEDENEYVYDYGEYDYQLDWLMQKLYESWDYMIAKGI